MTFLICMFILVLFLTALVVLYKLQYFKVCAFLIMVLILLSSGWMGGNVAVSIHRSLSPYFFFGVDKVRSQNIKVMDYRDGKYFFSNGEIIPTDKSSALEVIWRVVFVLVGGTILLIGHAVGLRLTSKFSPGLYQGLAYFGSQKKKKD